MARKVLSLMVAWLVLGASAVIRITGMDSEGLVKVLTESIEVTEMESVR